MGGQKMMLKVTQEKKLIGNRGVKVSEGELVEQLEPADEDGLISVRTASGETGLIKQCYLESKEKVLKMKTRQRLLGCPGRVYLEAGSQVYEVEPEDDGLVTVRTAQ